MGTALRSVNDALAAAQSKGMLKRFWNTTRPASTAATATSGGVTVCRIWDPFTIPTLGSGVTGALLTYMRIGSLSQGMFVAAFEYPLASYTAGGSPSYNGPMPTRVANGVSTVLGSPWPLLFVSSNITGTPTFTITYTNQSGVTGKTATLTLPATAGAYSCFQIGPHLAAGDTGIREVTGISLSSGTYTAGTVQVVGCMPLAVGHGGGQGGGSTTPPLSNAFPHYALLAGDVIAVYHVGSQTTASHVYVCLGMIADN